MDPAAVERFNAGLLEVFLPSFLASPVHRSPTHTRGLDLRSTWPALAAQPVASVTPSSSPTRSAGAT